MHCCCWVTSIMSDSVRPHRQQPTRLTCPWDSPGKNTGVGCHFLLQCMKGKGESEVAQLCPTLSDPMDCSPPGSSINGIFQARVLEWGAIAFPFIMYYYFAKRKDPILKANFYIFFIIFVILFGFLILYFWESNLYSRFLIFAFWYLLSILYL